jgi:hypothetical protein
MRPVSVFVLVPDAARPRLLVPRRPRSVAAAAVRRYTSPTSQAARARQRILALLMATGLGPALMRDRVAVYAATPDGPPSDTIESYLASVLKGHPLHVSLHVGPARANRKPVLQVLDSSGDTLAFAKVGTNELTRALVRAEAATLTFLSGQPLLPLVVPSLLHHGRWHGHEVLVQSALPGWRCAEVPPRAVLEEAMRRIAAVRGTEVAVLARSEYWQGLRRKAASLSDDAIGLTVRRVLDDLDQVGGTVPMTMGSWHGDWTRWNLAPSGERVLAWDWERFSSGVPLGYDALHFDLQDAVTAGHVPPERAVAATLTRASELIAPFGVPGEQARVTAGLYLVELAVRYLQDGQAQAGARLGHLGEWLLPALVGHARALAAAAP